jgi:probable rRNA maturation factor
MKGVKRAYTIGIRFDKKALTLDRAWLKKAVRAILSAAGFANGELSIYICDADTMLDLNSTWRGKDDVTDVLSFAQHEGEPGFPDAIFGDIVICTSRALEQAKEAGVTYYDEVLTLLVHGIAHLAGHDHEKGRRLAKAMVEFEQKLKQEAEAALAAQV